MAAQRWFVVAVTGLVAVGAAGCTVQGDKAKAAPVAATRPSATTTTPSPSTSATPPAPSVTTGVTSPALTAALNRLAADSQALKTDPQLGAVRTGVSAGLATARKGMQTTRSGAYPIGTRSCSSVAAGLAVTRSGTAAVERAMAPFTGAAAVRQAQIDRLAQSIALTRSLSSKQPATASPSPAEIVAALKAASAQQASAVSSLAATRASTADALAKSRSMSAAASDIYAKLC
jgi:hypothetical protein